MIDLVLFVRGELEAYYYLRNVNTIERKADKKNDDYAIIVLADNKTAYIPFAERDEADKLWSLLSEAVLKDVEDVECDRIVKCYIEYDDEAKIAKLEKMSDEENVIEVVTVNG